MTEQEQEKRVLCSTCSLIIAKMLSDSVRPPNERGKLYDLVLSDKVRTE